MRAVWRGAAGWHCENGGVTSATIEEWQRAGRFVRIGERRVFVAETPGEGTPVVIVHGYPGSSFDFAGVMPALGAPAVALDLLGFGLSDKPTTARYSLFEQADVVEAVVAACGIKRCVLVGHDMGTTVVAELVARGHAGDLSFSVEQVFLTNGSIFIDMAMLTRGQRLALRLGGRALPFPLPIPVLRRSLRESIAPGTRITSESLERLVELIRVNGGDRLLTRQIAYIRERQRHQAQWTAALVLFPGKITTVWGVLDPIAVPDMPRRLGQLRPATELVWLEDVGHWPSIEAPERLAAEIRRRL